VSFDKRLIVSFLFNRDMNCKGTAALLTSATFITGNCLMRFIEKIVI
jgi:hypothetical protein